MTREQRRTKALNIFVVAMLWTHVGRTASMAAAALFGRPYFLIHSIGK
jgi:hypothetical protein